jgi:hypothetical protein
MVYLSLREAMRLSFRDGEKAEKGAVQGLLEIMDTYRRRTLR